MNCRNSKSAKIYFSLDITVEEQINYLYYNYCSYQAPTSEVSQQEATALAGQASTVWGTSHNIFFLKSDVHLCGNLQN